MESHERQTELWGSATVSSGSLVQTTCDTEDPTTCMQTEHITSDVACKSRERTLQNEEIASHMVEDDAKKEFSITKLQASILLLQQEVVNSHAQLELSRRQTEQQSFELSLYQQKEEILLYKLKMSDANVKQLEETTVSLRATQDSLRRTLVLNEKNTQQLLEDKAHLKASLSALQSQLQTSERAVNDIRATLDRARVSLDAERQMRQQIQEQSEHISKELACLQQEPTNVHCNTEKKELKIFTLVKELHEKRLTDYQEKENDLEILGKERDDLRAKMEDVNSQHGQLIHTKDTLEADFAVCQEKLHACHLELATSEKELQKQQVHLDLLLRQLKEAREELEVARLQAEEQKEMAVIFKHKYTAAMEKVHKLQGQVKHLAEELQYSQQQLKESQQASHFAHEELSELKRRHHDKVGQWESSQEALHQLTDELHVSQNLLTERQQKVDHFRCLVQDLQGQLDTLEQQKVVLECDLRLYQQSHSHADEDYLSLQRHEQKLQKRCSEQVERLVVCEKVILQMKSELERQSQEEASVKHSLVTSHRAHLKQLGQMEQEVAQLKEKVAHLEHKLADSQKGCLNLLRQSEEALQEGRQEAARSRREVDILREEVRRLEDVRHNEEEKLKSADREKQSLSTQVRQLSQELAELHCKHQTTVELLAARSEEAKRMVACVKEEEQAQDKTRVMTRRLELEVAELKRNLQQTDMEKKHAQAQVDTLQSKLAASCSDNDNIRHESQLVVTNLKRWITDQKHLQESNDTLKAEVKRLKEMAAGQEKELGSVKAQRNDVCALQDEKILDKETCMALNLGRLAKMQTKLQRNMDAISSLNQQLKALSEENKHLRRQLVESHQPPTSVHLSSPSPALHPSHLPPT
ncbi:uncharacterized protein LOC144040752 isoform X2 [Vanacampus margaritifer]